MAFNKVILMGRLTSVPELKQMQGGTCVTSFAIAVDRKYSGAERKTDFPTVVAFGKTAEFVRNYFTKGSPILVCGELQTRTWQDSQGNNRYATEVVASEVSFCGTKSERETGNAGRTQSGAQRENSPAQGQTYEKREDDDLPF